MGGAKRVKTPRRKSGTWVRQVSTSLNTKKSFILKFVYSEKATKFCEIFTLLLSYVVPVQSKVKISQNIVAFSEYMNFNIVCKKFFVIWNKEKNVTKVV